MGTPAEAIELPERSGPGRAVLDADGDSDLDLDLDLDLVTVHRDWNDDGLVCIAVFHGRDGE